MGNLDKSTIAMIFFLSLVALFLIMIIATIAVIISSSRKKDEEYDEEDEDNIEVNNLDDEYANQQYSEEQYSDEQYSDENYDDNYQGDNQGIFQDAEEDLGDMSDSAFVDNYDAEQDSAFADNYDAEQDSAFADEYGDMSDSAFAENDVDPYQIDEPTNEIDTDYVKESSREKKIDDIQESEQMTGEEVTTPIEEEEETTPLSLEEEEETTPLDFDEELDDFDEDAADENVQSTLSETGEALNAGINYDALKASVAEAAVLADAVKDDMNAEQTTIGAMFGISEEMSKFGSNRKKKERSTVASDEEFYWFNRDDVESRPSHRKPELYYHYFSVPDDCIEDLLVEMYDCAVVRTEEIRYIAYGIEPKSYSMKQIMSAGFDVNQGKKKNPSTQDMVKIYEKWCVYVDNLLDKIEIHADEYTIEAIRQKLCDYGRSDVEVLLEGK